MPKLKCPICGILSHLNVVEDLAGWYSYHFPEISIGEIVPYKCFDCFPEIQTGDLVVLRVPISDIETAPTHPVGKVIGLLPSNDKTLFNVQFAEKVMVLARSKIRKLWTGS